MARTTARPVATREVRVDSERRRCEACGARTRADWRSLRCVTTLTGCVGLSVQVRVCHREGCLLEGVSLRAEGEGRWVLPEHEFGLDVLAFIGAQRYREHRSVPEIHALLRHKGVAVSERTCTNLLDRYDELISLTLLDSGRLQAALKRQGRAVLAIDGLAPDVGHEVLWVVRECLSGQVLLARPLLSGGEQELVPLLEEVKRALGRVPIVGVVSDGQRSIRNALAHALPQVPHQLCHFHYLREAARPLYEADRHAKKELKKRVRKVRKVERTLEGRQDAGARATQAYAAAVRSALTDDHRPPLSPSGLLLRRRLGAIEKSLERVFKRGAFPPELSRLHAVLRNALRATAASWPALARAYRWVERTAAILKNEPGLDAAGVRRRLAALLAAMVRWTRRRHQGVLRQALAHFLLETRRYWKGLFHCYDVPELPRTDNDLEHLFGTCRFHERRASGRVRGSAGLVVRGGVRLPAIAAAQLLPALDGTHLAPGDLDAWRTLRAQLEQRRVPRVMGRRFRADPDGYLRGIEEELRPYLPV
ncbi:ISNCY family transposase [Myxococcus sp. MISCRS1]|uniref:ISNCY family transposase n=1 Tax=Myxococcus sp. MISCRS1 TaxID=2996786 RepID=UPI00227029F7|nr:ISNCY family transposase [Myxococcus sp. MISCRS1]MCY1001032.1 ISNCY family transposase [Myxococcus sp. MISCRS1]